jgi:multidrug efflux system membrane fusion protein
MKLRYFLLLFLLVPVLWLGVRYVSGETISVVKPQRGEAVQAVYATGTVEATVMLPIAPRVSAKLATLNVDEGAEVTKGQVLAQLEDEDLQSSLRQFYAREAQAKSNYFRKAELFRQRTITRADYDNARADWDAAKAATSRALTEANFMKLTAPDDGMIIKRDGEIGQLIGAQQPLFWMQCCAPLRITAEVNEEDISKVAVGQEVLIRADAFPDEVFEGKVQSITPKGDPIARTYRVRVAFSDENPLRIGMTAETNIIIARHENAMLIPSSAVVNGHVWQVVEGTLQLQKIKTGARGLEKTEILEGLQPDALIAIAPDITWQAGQKVRHQLQAQ